MRMLMLFIPLLLIWAPSHAEEIALIDSGIFQVARRDHLPTDSYIRLSYHDERWLLEKKEAGGRWNAVECSDECQFRNATSDELATLFPQSTQSGAEIACLKSSTHAFCTVRKAGSSKEKHYALIYLGNGKRTPPYHRPLIRIAAAFSATDQIK